MMDSNKAHQFMLDNQAAVQAVVDLFESHQLRTEHMPVKMYVSGKEEYVCECGKWDVAKIMAEAANAKGEG